MINWQWNRRIAIYVRMNTNRICKKNDKRKKILLLNIDICKTMKLKTKFPCINLPWQLSLHYTRLHQLQMRKLTQHKEWLSFTKCFTQWIIMEHAGDNYISHDCCLWYSHQRIIKGTGGLELGGWVETIQTTTLLRTTRILRKVLGTWGELLSHKIRMKIIIKPWCEKHVKE